MRDELLPLLNSLNNLEVRLQDHERLISTEEHCAIEGRQVSTAATLQLQGVQSSLDCDFKGPLQGLPEELARQEAVLGRPVAGGGEGDTWKQSMEARQNTLLDKVKDLQRHYAALIEAAETEVPAGLASAMTAHKQLMELLTAALARLGAMQHPLADMKQRLSLIKVTAANPPSLNASHDMDVSEAALQMQGAPTWYEGSRPGALEDIPVVGVGQGLHPAWPQGEYYTEAPRLPPPPPPPFSPRASPSVAFADALAALPLPSEGSMPGGSAHVSYMPSAPAYQVDGPPAYTDFADLPEPPRYTGGSLEPIFHSGDTMNSTLAGVNEQE